MKTNVKVVNLFLVALIVVLMSFALHGCGKDSDDGPVFTVGGTVSGLVGTGLVLQNNGGDDLALSADGPFTFATVVGNGAAYAVTVKPVGWACF